MGVVNFFEAKGTGDLDKGTAAGKSVEPLATKEGSIVQQGPHSLFDITQML